MECPRCGNTKLSVIDTRSVGGFVNRMRLCQTTEEGFYKGCGLRFETRERISYVKVYSREEMSDKSVKLEEYREKWLPFELGEKEYPRQGVLFK